MLRASPGASTGGWWHRHRLRLRFGPWASTWLGGRTVIRWRGVDVEVDPGEAHGFHVFVHGDYGGAELDACVELCRSARVLLDVGAHIGLISLAVARACPDLRVVAFEADPEIAAWCRRNAALNPDLAGRITIVEAAVADRDGHVTFAASDGPANVGTGRVVADGDGTRRVRALALGSFLEREGLTADVIKIDIEGGELAALDGLWAAGRPRALLIETHAYLADAPADFNSRLLETLVSHGYRVDRLSRGTWRQVADAASLGSRSHLRAVLEPA